MTNFYQVYLANISVVIALIAIYLCLPFSGIKIKKFGPVYTFSYASISAFIFLGCLYVGAVILFMSFWVALAGGAWAFGLFTLIALAIAILAMFANYLTLRNLAKYYPQILAITSPMALKVTSSLIVCTQIGSIFLFEKFELLYKSPKIAMGYIDKTGKTVIAPAFGDVEKFHDGKAITWAQDSYPSFSSTPSKLASYSLIDRSGKTIKSITPDERAALKAKYKALNLEDYPEPCFQKLDLQFTGEFQEGLSVVCNEQYQKGYVDKTGKLIYAYQFSDARQFSEGLAAVSPYGQWGYMDHSGKMVIPAYFQKAGPFHQGLAPVAISNPKRDDRYNLGSTTDDLLYGYIDKRGNFVIPPMFFYAYPFSEGLAGVQVDLNKLPRLEEAQKLLKRYLYQREHSEFR